MKGWTFGRDTEEVIGTANALNAENALNTTANIGVIHEDHELLTFALTRGLSSEPIVYWRNLNGQPSRSTSSPRRENRAISEVVRSMLPMQAEVHTRATPMSAMPQERDFLHLQLAR